MKHRHRVAMPVASHPRKFNKLVLVVGVNFEFGGTSAVGQADHRCYLGLTFAVLSNTGVPVERANRPRPGLRTSGVCPLGRPGAWASSLTSHARAHNQWLALALWG